MNTNRLFQLFNLSQKWLSKKLMFSGILHIFTPRPLCKLHYWYTLQSSHANNFQNIVHLKFTIHLPLKSASLILSKNQIRFCCVRQLILFSLFCIRITLHKTRVIVFIYGPPGWRQTTRVHVLLFYLFIYRPHFHEFSAFFTV